MRELWGVTSMPQGGLPSSLLSLSSDFPASELEPGTLQLKPSQGGGVGTVGFHWPGVDRGGDHLLSPEIGGFTVTGLFAGMLPGVDGQLKIGVDPVVGDEGLADPCMLPGVDGHVKIGLDAMLGEGLPGPGFVAMPPLVTLSIDRSAWGADGWPEEVAVRDEKVFATSAFNTNVSPPKFCACAKRT